MMHIFIEPLDVLLFRDSRPFTAGETQRAKVQFPPSPVTLQGAIRTAMMVHQGIDPRNLRGNEITKLIGSSADDYGRLRLRGPFLAQREKDGAKFQLLFPMPRHALLQRKDQEFGFLKPLGDKEKELPHGWAVNPGLDEDGFNFGLLSSTGLGGEAEAAQGDWLTAEGLLQVLQDVSPVSESLAVSKDGLFLPEPRLGIELDLGRRTAAEGKLYSAEFIRLKEDTGFLLEISLEGDEGDETMNGLLPSEGLLALGGERRGAHYRRVEVDQLDSYGELISGKASSIAEGDKQFFLYLATPAVFQRGRGKPGWLPNWIDAQSLRGEHNNLKFRVIAAAVGKSLPIGGWDLQRRRPKPLVRAVPAGSIYFCELEGGNMEDIRNLHNQMISEAGWEIGMGLTFIGRWDYV
jgi:CRISPR-associated protein Cmr3